VEEVETSTRDANDDERFTFSARNPVAHAGAEGELNDEQREGKKINCFECRHFFITHEPARPYGCQAMGFKSRELPSSAVLRSSGEPCLLHVPKGRLESD
jgi:hypothetical protein